MYSFLNNTSSLLCSQIRDDIFSLLGNSGKTLFTPDQFTYSFSVPVAFTRSIRRLFSHVESLPYVRPLAYILICLTSFFVVPTDTSFAASVDTATGITTEKTFIVTAYYSPIPGQKDYFRGSYEADIRLNGQGIQGASGAPVFTGMLAAPKTYAFGTQVFFEGLGLGRVEDRGGAIVEASSTGPAHDRIDIWMGYGDAGLRRTIAWGRRMISGKIVTNVSSYTPIDLAGIDSGRINLSEFPNATSQGSPGGLSAGVIDEFADLGYTVTGGDVAAMVKQFQIDHSVIMDTSDPGVGVFGPKTRAALTAAHATYETLRAKEMEIIEENKKKLLADHDTWQDRYQRAMVGVTEFGKPKYQETGTHIKKLQEFLKAEGIYHLRPNGQMTQPTILALKKYQKIRGLKQTGIIDDMTQGAMVDDIVDRKIL